MTEPFRESFRAPADAAAIGRVHELFERLGEQCGELSESFRGGFELAVVEIVTNVVRHSEDGRDVRVELLIRTTDDGIEAVITDDAEPVALDLAAVAMPDADELAESGRGLALVSLLVDDFAHEPLARGNRWRLSAAPR